MGDVHALHHAALEGFSSAFSSQPDLVAHAPGRVNLLGEHTDYNLGFVLPMAIDRGTCVAARATQSGRLRARSAQQPGELDVSLDALATEDGPPWGAYVRGPVDLLRQRGVAPAGLEVFLTGDLPLGSGLSSSASVEVGVAAAVLALGQHTWAAADIARLAQEAEHRYAHVHCGIMDQLAVAAGCADHALLIDCRSTEVTPVPLPESHRVLVLDTHAPRTLAHSAYNARRATCEAAAHKLGVASLRDVSLEGAALPGNVTRRLGEEELRCVRHVATENGRVLACVEAFATQDMITAGRLWSASHASLRDDYRVSSAALDAMVAAALGAPGVVGARLTGAGFGGCVVALVASDAAEAALATALARFAATHPSGSGFVARPSAAARVLAPATAARHVSR